MKWPQLSLSQLEQATATISDQTYRTAERIVNDVRVRGEEALREFSVTFGDISPKDPIFLSRDELNSRLPELEQSKLELLKRTAGRIERFAIAQKEKMLDCQLEIDGGTVGHRWLPLRSAGCYAPGGRYPLPSSVLMTAVTARVAGVESVWIASPKPTLETIAAASISGADGLLTVGGAQAIAAMAAGINSMIPSCDVIVGPGNRFVTAAKALVARTTRIDMLAGPSELVVVASTDADPKLVAADLLAQAEHDIDARPILITNQESFANAVIEQLSVQLETLPTSDVASAALQGGGFVLVDGVEQAIDCCRRIAPEHLSLQGKTFEGLADRFDMGAALFIGTASAEVLGDYGAGPNHVLPTGGSARSQSPLSVATFMRFQTRMHITDPDSANGLAQDAAALGRIEGLEAHARSAELRCRN